MRSRRCPEEAENHTSGSWRIIYQKYLFLFRAKKRGFLERNTVCVYAILWSVTFNLSDKEVSMLMTTWSNKNVTERCVCTVAETRAVQHAREYGSRTNKYLQKVLLGSWLSSYELDCWGQYLKEATCKYWWELCRGIARDLTCPNRIKWSNHRKAASKGWNVLYRTWTRQEWGGPWEINAVLPK